MCAVERSHQYHRDPTINNDDRIIVDDEEILPSETRQVVVDETTASVVDRIAVMSCVYSVLAFMVVDMMVLFCGAAN